MQAMKLAGEAAAHVVISTRGTLDGAKVEAARREEHSIAQQFGKNGSLGFLGWKHEAEDVLSSLERLPSVVDMTRRKWTIALAFASTRVPGDFVETGVFKGGTSIAMMRVLDRTPGLEARRHWACDSFLGIPPPSPKDAANGPRGAACKIGKCSRGRNARAGLWHSTRATFEENVRKYNVTSSRLRIVEGWFRESLPPAGLERISFLRLDGDLYNSTRDAIERLEPLVSPGGFIYVDDYGSFRGCAAAIDEYRAAKGLAEPMHPIAAGQRGKFEGLWWRKAQSWPERVPLPGLLQ